MNISFLELSKQQFGSSLLEVLLALSIIAILLLQGGLTAGKDSKLQFAAAEVQQVIQSEALKARYSDTDSTLFFLNRGVLLISASGAKKTVYQLPKRLVFTEAKFGTSQYLKLSPNSSYIPGSVSISDLKSTKSCKVIQSLRGARRVEC